MKRLLIRLKPILIFAVIVGVIAGSVMYISGSIGEIYALYIKEEGFLNTQRLVSKRHAGAKAVFIAPDYKVFDTANTASNVRVKIEGVGVKTTREKVYGAVTGTIKDLIIGDPIMTILIILASTVIPSIMSII